MRTLTLALLLTLPLAARAQPPGLALVEATGQGSGLALAALPDAAFALATRSCMETAAAAADCRPVGWCFPVGWSVDRFLHHRKRIHRHILHGGRTDRDAARALAAATRASGLADQLINGTPARLVHPEGNQIDPGF